MAKQPADNPDHDDMSFFAHLAELRDRLVRSAIVVAVIFTVLFYYANDIYNYIARPMLEQLAGNKMIITKPASAFFTPIKVAFMTSLFVAIPYLLYQLWAFIAPGLYRHEKRLAVPLLASSTILFYCGMAFAYYVVFPLVFKFFAGTTPEGASLQPDIVEYLDLVLSMFFAFGIAFEVPVAIVLLVVAGIVTPDQLSGMRRYVIVGAFIVAMILTPPDVVSQVLLAIPMWILYEIGIIVSRMIYKRRETVAESQSEMTDEDMDQEFNKAIAEEAELLRKIEDREKP